MPDKYPAKAGNKGRNLCRLLFHSQTSPVEEYFPLPDFLNVCKGLRGYSLTCLHETIMFCNFRV